MLRLRQICLVAADLDAAEADLRAVFGLEVCYRDAGVACFGLRNFLMPVGNGFLEIVAPFHIRARVGHHYLRALLREYARDPPPHPTSPAGDNRNFTV